MVLASAVEYIKQLKDEAKKFAGENEHSERVGERNFRAAG